MVYDPLQSPFELPVQRLSMTFLADPPLRPEVKTIERLASSFNEGLWEQACLHRRDAAPCRRRGDRNPRCQGPADCPVRWLYKPYSAAHKRNLTPPVLLYPGADRQDEPAAPFNLQVTLWGRQAIRHQSLVARILEQPLVRQDGGWVNPKVLAQQAAAPRTLAERVAAIAVQPVRRLLLDFVTPFVHQEWVQLAPDHSERLIMAGGVLPIGKILGNLAYELTAWDMEDRDVGEQLPREARDRLAEQARDEALQRGDELTVVRSQLKGVPVHWERSRSNEQRYPLGGFRGIVELAGDIEAVLPWLVALAVGGGGQRRALGYGRVRLWLESGATAELD